jgi:hypothetical protein
MSDVEYQVVVTRIEKDVPFKNQEYKQVAEKKNGDPEYGYVYFDDTRDVKVEIYDQTVEELDLAKLVSVVNNLDA